MKKYSSFLTVIAVFLFFQTAFAASDTIINIRPEPQVEEYSPGTIILLPDGRRTIIDEAMPGGKWKTEEGLIIDRNGVFEDSGQKAVIINPSGGPYLARGTKIELPDGRTAIIEEILPNGDLKTDLGVILKPDGTVREDVKPSTAMPKNSVPMPKAEKVEEFDPKRKAENSVPKQPQNNPEKKDIIKIVPEAQKKADNLPGKKSEVIEPKAEADLTLAQMLPLTKVPQGEQQKAVKEKTPGKIEAPEPKQKESHKEVPVKEKHKAAPEGEKHQSKPHQPEKQEKKPVLQKKEHKTPVGQELKIPPEAAKTGNLDFLEGCWQGTRPEYYSKRTIKECFCFGANGSNGKRRVIDPLGKRKCIGATRAHLSPNGVLSVTSEGAYCSDGERWGQAEMVCRNSGPRTPCSWVFRDANNGSQSYQIPFIRVESCGR